MSNIQHHFSIIISSSLAVIFSMLGMVFILLFKSPQMSSSTLKLVPYFFVFFAIVTILGIVSSVINFRIFWTLKKEAK